MEIVAHRIGVGEHLEVGNVPLLDVIKAHRRGALFSVWRREETGWRRQAIAAGADRRFYPWKQVVHTLRLAAIELLPHLVEAMHGAFRVVVIGHSRRQLAGPR